MLWGTFGVVSSLQRVALRETLALIEEVEMEAVGVEDDGGCDWIKGLCVWALF